MTHTASHIIISALETQVSGKTKVWHYAAAACVVCFALGKWVF